MPTYRESRRTLNELLRGQEERFRRAFLGMIRSVYSQLTLNRIIELVSRGDFEDAITIIQAEAERLPLAYSRNFNQSVAYARSFIRDNLSIVIDLDMVNGRALAFNQGNMLRLVRQVTDDQRAVIRAALVEGNERGLNPRAIARNIRNSIGLTEYQAGIIRNYTEELSGDFPSLRAIGRELNDGRFNSTIRRANRNREALTQQMIDRMVRRYQERWIAFRAETIGRTEGLRTLNIGIEEVYNTAIESGQFDDFTVNREWFTARDERVRSSHASIQGQIVAFNQAFTTGAGNTLRYPSDPQAPVSETANCRCQAVRIIAEVQ